MGVEEKASALDFKGVAIGSIVSAFGFVVALFWRDAIKAFIDEVIPSGEGLVYQFYAAIIVTVIAVVFIFIVTKYISKIELKRAIEIKKELIKEKKPRKRAK